MKYLCENCSNCILLRSAEFLCSAKGIELNRNNLKKECDEYIPIDEPSRSSPGDYSTGSVVYEGQLYNVGDKVKSQYHPSQQDIVRKITRIEVDEMCGSGFRASADGGEKCKCCGIVPGYNIDGVDLAWFNKLSEPIE